MALGSVGLMAGCDARSSPEKPLKEGKEPTDGAAKDGELKAEVSKGETEPREGEPKDGAPKDEKESRDGKLGLLGEPNPPSVDVPSRVDV